MPIRWQVGEKTREKLIEGKQIANQRLVCEALDLIRIRETGEAETLVAEQTLLSEAADIAEITCLDLLAQRQALEPLDAETRQACEAAFRILLWISPPQVWSDQLKHILKTACLGLLAERTADTRRWLRGMKAFVVFEPAKSSWAENVFFYVASAFLRNIRQSG